MLAHLALLLALAAPAEGACPALFGATTGPAPGIVEIVEGADCVDIVQSAGFDAPVPERVRGLDLIATDPLADRATLRLGAELARVCAPGLYTVTPGELIGDMRVIAVLQGAVLAVDGDHLAYLLVPGARPPVFRMTWASPWRLVASPGSEAPGPASPESSPVDPRDTPAYRAHLRAEGRL